jgi:hypothetical protein
MKQKTNLLLKSSLTSGIYLGLISILISVLIWAGGLIESMGIFGGAILGLSSLAISFILLILFAKGYRNREFDGYISFREVFKFTLLAIIFSTLISILYSYIFNSFIAPDYLENLMAAMQQKTMDYMTNAGVPDSQIDKAMEKFEEIPTIWKTLKQTAFGGLIGGVVIALIASAIVKKNKHSEVAE